MILSPITLSPITLLPITLPRLHAVAAALLLVSSAGLTAAWAQAPAPQHEEDCGEIERNYELVKSQAVSVQINMALFAAADRGCEALAHKLIGAGASPLARDRRGAMPLAHAARAGQPRIVTL